MHRVIVIALNTFRENRRDRVLYVLLAFAAGLLLVSMFLGTFSPWEQSKILLDLAQSSIAIIGTLIAVFLGVSLVTKEIDKRTVFSILSKPVRRWEFMVGKFLGLAITLGVAALVMGALTMLAVRIQGATAGLALIESIALLYIEMLVVTAAALLFSSYATAPLAAMCTAGVWIIGHLAQEIQFLGSRADTAVMRAVSSVVYHIVPNLEILNAKGSATYGEVIPATDFFGAVAYGLLYTGALLAIAVAVFEHRDFK